MHRTMTCPSNNWVLCLDCSVHTSSITSTHKTAQSHARRLQSNGSRRCYNDRHETSVKSSMLCLMGVVGMSDAPSTNKCSAERL